MWTDPEVIHGYSRARAIEDGVLVDATKAAKEAGFRVPVALTREVWDRYVEHDTEDQGQSIEGRLWDVLWMLRCKINREGGSVLMFELYVAMPDRGDWQTNEAVPERGTSLTRRTHRRVQLKAVCGPGDKAEPVITIMLPSQD